MDGQDGKAGARHYRACGICEAICGLAIDVRDGVVERIEGDPDDPMSRGYLCPKAYAALDLQNDPDRLRRPLRRVGDDWEPIGWDAALDLVAGRLHEIRARAGADAIGVYLGNPVAHSLGAMTHPRYLLGQLRTRNVFSATSVDQLAHHVAAYWMYGHQMLIPVPDLDRTRYLLILGANPVVSNGSLMTAPGMPRRLRELRRRGGRLVVVDPRRTETARVADVHHFIRPGTDVYLLLALLQVIFAESLAAPGRLHAHLTGYERLPELVAQFTPERVAPVTGIEAAHVRAIARDFAAAAAAACYGRLGVSTQAFGALCQWLIQLLNLVTGNLDRVGGTLLPAPAVDLVAQGLLGRGNPGRAHSRVSGRPSFGGELPAALMAEEIRTAGEGRMRAMLMIAGNPVLSTPGGKSLDRALPTLEFMVAIDYYVNETTRHAQLILPPTTPFERDHYDFASFSFAVRNTVRYNPPLLARPAAALHDWEIVAGITERLAVLGGRRPPRRRAPARLLDVALVHGPYGRRRGHAAALSLARLRAAPHGIDLGPLAPSLVQRLATADRRIQCVPEPMLIDLSRALRVLANPPAHGDDTLLLVGRRLLGSNNSWLHNYPRFTRGDDRCVLLVHPRDLGARNLADGDSVRVEVAHGGVEVRVRADSAMMPGVVSLPHGWGHSGPGIRLAVASRQPGVSFNDLTDAACRDELSGAAVLNGVPVRLVLRRGP
ncbi:MAG: molybdopterin-dependent oxidoreductase [Gammaproteobacteria bacterium]|nr:molybdopterin-dependent oxidoreductase [Gammaproteobacteria bacterium]